MTSPGADANIELTFDATGQGKKGASMIEDKLLRVKQRPEQIVEHQFRFFPFLEKAFKFAQLLFGRWSCQAAQVKIFDNLLGLLILLEEFFDDAALVDLVLDGTAIQKVQRLGQVWLRLDFA